MIKMSRCQKKHPITNDQCVYDVDCSDGQHEKETEHITEYGLLWNA